MHALQVSLGKSFDNFKEDLQRERKKGSHGGCGIVVPDWEDAGSIEAAT